MGLPGFFAWILKKYASDILLDNLSKNPKYLYIDANCLFHPECFKILEGYSNDDLESLKSKMFKRIVNYLDFLEKYVKPTEIMYIAVDGTAPLAKIIQQRKRRYKTELDNFMKNEIKIKYGVTINDSWSNTSITPGTEFMEDLHKYIFEHYENKKCNKIKKLKYIYSSYHTPGEGEHKILQHIKKYTNLDDDIVIYGLDADLIFLAMASNRKNIFLLREQTLFQQKNKDKDKDNNKQENKQIDYINDVMREMTFVSIKRTKESYNKDMKEKLFTFSKSKKYEKHKILNNMNDVNYDFSNDLIFICFLLGNDFLPHFPSIDIHTEGLDALIESYMKCILNLDSHLVYVKNNDIEINTYFFQIMIEDMGNKEDEYFYEKLYAPNNFLERHKRKRCFEEDEYKKELWKMDNLKNKSEKEEKDNLQLGIDDKDIWKYRYYEYHFKVSGQQDKFIDKLVIMYLDGIKWVSEYYFNECPDWKWSYLCHYAPFISDIARFIKEKNIDLNNIKFNNNKHVPMMTQLVSVLPPSCKNYLPKSYKYLVTDFSSPIIDMFPKKVQIDTLYKCQLYQCVPLIPYLNIDRVIDVTRNLKLSNEEKERSKIFDDIIF
jgi:5'-3' exonuclease